MATQSSIHEDGVAGSSLGRFEISPHRLQMLSSFSQMFGGLAGGIGPVVPVSCCSSPFLLLSLSVLMT